MYTTGAVIILMSGIVTGFNSKMYESNQVAYERESRFITFNNDKSNIRLEMVFAIPFLHIPIGGQPHSDRLVQPTVDINVKSLVAAGVVFFVLFFIVPGVIRVTFPNTPISRGWENSEAGRLLQRMEASLTNAGFEPNACLNQGMCYLVQTATENVSKGQASSWEKIIDGITSNSWIYSIIPHTYLPNNCASINYTCPLMEYDYMDIQNYLKQNVKKMFNFNGINLG